MSKKIIALITLIVLCLGTTIATAAPIVGPVTPANSIIGGNAGDQIGTLNMKVLPSGNVLIVSPNWNGNRGAVTCLTPAQYQTGNIVISAANSLTGSSASDSVGFGVTILSNGNYVVISPFWDNGGTADVGAVTWGNGNTCSTNNLTVSAANSLVGSTINNTVGMTGVTALTNGHYVVISSNWDGAADDVGAVTWCDGTTGCTGAVSAANSLVGSTDNDEVGFSGVTALTNGNYVVASQFWDNGSANGAGAITWCDGTTGCTGAVSAANSLVGLTIGDGVGFGGARALTNGNYVVRSPFWDGGAADIGAVTWCDGMTGCTGAISAANSLVGSTANDNVGSGGITALPNDNYVVSSRSWDGAAPNVGAVTWCDGTTGCTGLVSASNSLVGSTAMDEVGLSVAVLTNGNYLVRSLYWDGAAVDVGAVTWGNGLGGTVGVVSAANSLVGLTANDGVGYSLSVLPNGHYVVISRGWDGAAVNVGAITWGNGLGGTVGAVSATNSLVGSTSGDAVGIIGITVLTNGNYVVSSPNWDGAAADVGAVTWCSGTGGTVGAVSAANSLVGSTANDLVGNGRATALTNGNYVVSSTYWSGAQAAVGAVTWGNGLGGTVGAVSATNSLVGSTANDNVSFDGIWALTNGNYVVSSGVWDGAAADVGAITWGNGLGGTVGEINASNSLVGSTVQDRIGYGDVVALTDGNYVVSSQQWDGLAANVGAVTWGNGLGGTVGAVSTSNSLVGSIVNDQVGAIVIPALNGDYFVVSPLWNNPTGPVTDVGAVTYSNGGGSTELLLNGGFETANGGNAKQPLNWSLKTVSATNARRVCKTTPPLVAYAGNCAFQFKYGGTSTSPFSKRNIRQVITDVGGATTGQTLSFSAQVKARNWKSNARIVVSVVYPALPRQKLLLTIVPGTYDYSLLSGNLVLNGTPTSITIVISSLKGTGTLYIDAASLLLGDSVPLRSDTAVRDGALVMPLPSLPDGFRK